ncbi:methionine gamma-lyase family protein, partial [Siminovitchia fortis]
MKEMEEMMGFVKEIDGEVMVLVENWYGEFVETVEPCNVGGE